MPLILSETIAFFLLTGFVVTLILLSRMFLLRHGWRKGAIPGSYLVSLFSCLIVSIPFAYHDGAPGPFFLGFRPYVSIIFPVIIIHNFCFTIELLMRHWFKVDWPLQLDWQRLISPKFMSKTDVKWSTYHLQFVAVVLSLFLISLYAWKPFNAEPSGSTLFNYAERIIEDGGETDSSYRKALRYFQYAADNGHARSQTQLGILYETGTSVEADIQEAVRLYHKAAEQNEPKALYRLGRIYRSGFGVPQDEAHGRMLLEKAKKHGSEEAEQLLEEIDGRRYQTAKRDRGRELADKAIDGAVQALAKRVVEGLFGNSE
ncbi:MAG: sel1 repeat family protein [Verrucomicrobiae bacterium]|nr:sel1 repeat family protein [Verrucomicrobiae bacterium]